MKKKASEYNFLVSGFDVVVNESKKLEGYYLAKVHENGSEVYEVEIPPGEGESDEEIMHGIAKAAVDFFEAERGTLGEGAMAEYENQKESSVKKEACFCMDPNEEFMEEMFMTLKGTKYEDQALSFVQRYYDIENEVNSMSCSKESTDSKCEVGRLEHELRMMNLERMKSMKPRETVVVVKTGQMMNGGEVKKFLDKFSGHKMEQSAISKMRDYSAASKKYNEICEADSEKLSHLWQEKDSIVGSMNDLYIEYLQQYASAGAVEMQEYPNMANEIAELMQGVDIKAPIEPLGPMNGTPVLARRRGEKEEEDKHVPEPFIELGDVHEGLDPAEVDPEEFKFDLRDDVKLSKALEVVLPGGTYEELKKGEKGVITSLYDGHGDYYIVTFECGMTTKVHKDELSAA